MHGAVISSSEFQEKIIKAKEDKKKKPKRKIEFPNKSKGKKITCRR